MSTRGEGASPFVDGAGLLAQGDPSGPLAGKTFVAKDVFDVAGHPTGAGNPAWAAEQEASPSNAAAVDRLLRSGADLIGKVVTDELAWSLSGTNPHYGTPMNPAAPDRVPGGSSSGSAVAVAAGIADLGLGTDTGGSIRVPASYCGLFGMRPTHGTVPTDGMFPLAPNFDTVGLLARSATMLRAGWHSLAPDASNGGRTSCRRVVLATDVLACCDPGVAASVSRVAADVAVALGLQLVERQLHPRGTPLEWAGAFRVLQGAEAWAIHGDWLTTREPPLGPGVAERARFASTITSHDVMAALVARTEVGEALESVRSEDAIVVIPATPTAAHPLDLDAAERGELRSRTVACTAPASLGGAPSISLPLATDAQGLPVGVCLLGAPGDDRIVLDLAVEVEQQGKPALQRPSGD